MKTWLACLMLTLTASCATATAECSWARTIRPDSGFETRWTRSEKLAVVGHNRKVREFCR